MAAEGEELPGDRRGAIGGADDLPHIVPGLPGEIRCAQQEVAEAQDDLHHVVDLVRHTAGKGADHFHPLRLLQPLLELPRRLLGSDALGDVPDDEVRGRAAPIHEGDGPDFHREVGAVQPMQGLQNGRRRLRRAARLGQLGLHSLQVRGVEEGVDRLPDALGPPGSARQPDGGGVGENDPLPIVDQDAVRRQFDELLVPLVTLPPSSRRASGGPGTHQDPRARATAL